MGLPNAETRIDDGQHVEGERNASMYAFACKLRRQGLQRREALRRVLASNARRCTPPLDTAEVEGLVASAWNGELQGFAMLPYSLIYSTAFKNLSDAGKLAVIGLICQHDGHNNGRISFTRAEAERWRLDKRRRKNGLQDAKESGLIEYSEHGILGGAGHRATPDLFRLTFLSDRGQFDP